MVINEKKTKYDMVSDLNNSWMFINWRSHQLKKNWSAFEAAFWNELLQWQIDGKKGKRYKEGVALCDQRGRPGHFSTFNIKDGDKSKIEQLFTHVERYYIAWKNVTMERYRFDTRVQGKSESIDTKLCVRSK